VGPSGSVNDTWTISINEQVIGNGTLTRQYHNVSFSASHIDRATVTVEVGNRTWTWANVVINHRSIGYDGPGDNGENKKFSMKDLQWAQFKTALGVVIASLISIPLVWKGVSMWRSRQGVRQI